MLSLQKVGVYYGNWNGYGRNFQVYNIPGDKIDYLFYSFLDPSTGICQFSDSYIDLNLPGPIDGICGNPVQPSTDPLKGNMYQLMKLKQRYPNLKVIASIGGYTFSKAFKKFIRKEADRSTLVTSCVNLLKTYSSSFDGLDIDLEHPKLEDKENFATLLQEFRKLMGPIINFYNIMTYDFTGGEYQGVSFTGHHTQLKANSADPEPYRKTLSAENAANIFVKNGASPNKINIGAAFYGKSFKICQNSGKGPFVKSFGAPTQGTWEPSFFEYNDIVKNYLTNNNYFFDSVSQAPYIMDREKGLFITYDDIESIKAKTSFLREKGYHGIFAWQLAGDSSDFQLTQAMSQ